MQIPRPLLFVLLALLAILLWKLSPQNKAPSFSTEDKNSSPRSEKQQTVSEVEVVLKPSKPSNSGESRLELPAPDVAPLLADARDRDKKKLPFRFATPLQVNQTSSSLSPWSFKDGIASWELEVHAPDALSLNFAFDQFQMPPGGSLSLQSSESDQVITFTSRDNDEHGQLWTPIFKGDTVRLTASLPAVLLSDLRLRLAKVNYGFRNKKNSGKIGEGISDSCHVDVVCDADDVSFGAMIEAYRDQIRSVAAYTLDGMDTCTGALINNTNGDGLPYFLTANHCRVSDINASSMVLYWKFENSTCRLPGSPASGRIGDGNLTIFNSGAIFRSSFFESDFCLVELDDPVNGNSDAFFAGWDRSSSAPAEAVAIHHPIIAEKRISFEFDPLTITNYACPTGNATNTHLRVSDWDQGTTQGGSSGSPLFNSAGQIIGQLHGGSAACGNNFPDWYGRLFLSWTGGQIPENRLSDWLAPTQPAPLSIDGMEIPIYLSADDVAIGEGDSGTKIATVNIQLSESSATPVTFTVTTTGGTADDGSDYLDPGSQTVTISPPQTTASVEVVINGDSQAEENESISLAFSNISGAVGPPRPTAILIANDDFVVPSFASNLRATGNMGLAFEYKAPASNTPTSYSTSGQPAGLLVDPTNGVLTWNNPVQGSYSFNISATNPAGTSNATIEIAIGESHLKPAFEIPTTVALSGDITRWAVTSVNTSDGEDAITLVAPQDLGETKLNCIVEGPDELTFWWKGSTPYNVNIFSLLLDNSEVASLSGETGWHSQALTIPNGIHNVEFRFQRNSNSESGTNQVWLDRFSLKSISPPTFKQTSPLLLEIGTEVSLDISTIYDDSEINSETLPSNWNISPQGYLSGTPATPFSFPITANNLNGVTSRDYTVVPFTSIPSLAAALDLSDLIVRSSATPFITQSTLRTTGSTATRSAQLCGEGRSAMTAYAVGPGTLRFQWLVSSEEDYDYGYVLLDGKQVAVDSGPNSWSEIVLPLSLGLHEITWLYLKDDTVDENQDALFVDNVRLEGYAKWVMDNGMSPFSLPPGSGIDGDANPGLIEYAVGLSPVTSEAPHLLDLTGSPGDRDLSTPLDSTAIGLTLSIEKSATLAPDSWNSIGSTTSPFGATLSAPDPSGDAKAFYRLHATSP